MVGGLTDANGNPLATEFKDKRVSMMCNGGVPVQFVVEPGDIFTFSVQTNPDKTFQGQLVYTAQGSTNTLALTQPFDNLGELYETIAILLEIMTKRV